MAARTADAHFDACVVGSGAGGGAVAWALCRAGWRVLVLEKGPARPAAEVVHDELAVCRRPHFLPSPLDDPNVMVAGGRAPERTLDGWISSCVGGGTVHMSGYFFRMRADDFRLRALHGEVAGAAVADWPIADGEMDPFYEQAEAVLGLSGDAAAEPHPARRLRPYPLGPLLSHPAGALIDEACRRVGLHPFQVARAIVSAQHGERPACHYCGFCGSYGCETDSKSSTPATFLAAAARTGRLTLRAQAPVVQVLADSRRRATGVVVAGAGGARQRVRARVVVVAASAIQSARLLLLSNLANGSGLLGKNLMFQAQTSGWGRFALPHRSFPDGARALPFIDRGVQDLYVAGAAGLPHPKAGTLLFLLAHPNPIFQAERLAAAAEPPLFGAALKKRLKEFFLESRTVDFESFGEWLPTPGTHVSLDPEVKDRQGLPVARISVDAHPATRAVTELLGARGRAVLEAAGARDVGADPRQGPAARAGAYPFLQAGTARMGRSPASSVLDPTGQAHDVKNLYVADASGFPSSGGAPHTLTIMANALRIASHIVARGKAGTL